jgi:hypothetical protein
MGSQEELNALSARITGVEKKLEQLAIAIQGNEILGIEGIVQHMAEMQAGLKGIANDVKDLKDDKHTLKGWIAGLGAAGGIGGIIGNWFSKQ